MTEEFQEEESTEVVGGDTAELIVAPVGKRMAAAIIDLVVVPIILGFIFGLALIAAPMAFRTVVLVLVNVGWMCVRDLFNGAGPGKKMVGIKVVSVETGMPLTFSDFGKGAMRNIALIIPVLLVFGYLFEFFMLLFKGRRICDKWAKTAVVNV